MKKSIFALGLLLMSTAAFAGTAKMLEGNEIKVVTAEFNGSLTDCNLASINEELVVTCSYSSKSEEFQGTVTYDQIRLNRDQQVIGARFKSLVRE